MPAPSRAAASLRERRRLRTRRTIQAHALRLFADKGFQATTIEDIAAAAEMAPRTFFRYFPTKEEVVFWRSSRLCSLGSWPPGPTTSPPWRPSTTALSMAWPPSGTRTRSGSACWSGSAWPSGPRPCTPDAPAAGPLGGRAGGDPRRPTRRAPRTTLRSASFAAVAAAVWVAAEEWQAQDDGEGDLGALIDQALSTVLNGAPTGHTDPEHTMSEHLDHA